MLETAVDHHGRHSERSGNMYRPGNRAEVRIGSRHYSDEVFEFRPSAEIEIRPGIIARAGKRF